MERAQQQLWSAVATARVPQPHMHRQATSSDITALLPCGHRWCWI